MLEPPEPRAARGVQDLSLTTLSHKPSLKKVGAGTHGDNLETENMDQLCVFTCLLNHAQLALSYNSDPVAWGWFCLQWAGPFNH